MPTATAHNLVDVTALSQKLCTHPITVKLAYATVDNFIGRVIDGYSADVTDLCLMTPKAAYALCKVQNDLLENHQLGLFVYDSYRPLRAVKDFAQWFTQPIANETELTRKAIHYPNLKKTDLGPLGYIAEEVSRHNFGHAVDVTLIDPKTQQPLNLGTCFDFFDPLSHTNAPQHKIGIEAYQNRLILSATMQRHHFVPYQFEFWHFDYQICESNTPIDLPITDKLKNKNLNIIIS